MKKLADLNGVKALNKNEQKSINGGVKHAVTCGNSYACPPGEFCYRGTCNRPA